MGLGDRQHPAFQGNDSLVVRLDTDYELVKLGLSVAGQGDGLSDDGTRLALDALARIYHAANGDRR